MAAYDHRWLPMPPGAIARQLDSPSDVKIAMDAIMEALNVEGVGGSGWKFAGAMPGAIIVVRERPPVGTMTTFGDPIEGGPPTHPPRKK